jgi:hypothetical protein
MSRRALGIIAVLLLAVGGITTAFGPGGASSSGFAGGCIRVGMVLGALWLALPQIQATMKRLPGWIASWFVGKAKPGGGAEQNNAPVVRVKRPRRRGRA